MEVENIFSLHVGKANNGYAVLDQGVFWLNKL